MRGLIATSLLLTSGVFVIGLKFGLPGLISPDRMQREAAKIAGDVLPQVQLQVIAGQLKTMCPVKYDSTLTLLDVQLRDDAQIQAVYEFDPAGQSITSAQ